jgi:CO/xanthine dehydrogenase Mo-binding subunit
MGELSNLSRVPAAPVDVSRRSFLVGSAGAGVLMAFAGSAMGASAQDDLAARRFAPTVWFEMDSAGVTTVNIKRAEMGQHVGTALARIVADELELAWSDVRIVHVDSDPKWGLMVTGGSWSVHTSFDELSRAGAAGRIALIEAGAGMLGANAADCRARDSRVIAGDRSVSYAEIVRAGGLDRSFSPEELAALPLKPPAERRVIGADLPELDIPGKTDGTTEFGIDARLPGMLYARPVAPPTRFGSTVVSVDDAAARATPGYVGHVVIEDPSNFFNGWITVVAETFPAADKAAAALRVEWRPGTTTGVDEAALIAEGDRLCADPAAGALWVSDGDAPAAIAGAARTVDARYTTATALHFQLEPVNALAAQDDDGVWNIHCGNQFQTLIVPVLAQALGVEESQVVIRQRYLGGGYGRRLWGDYAILAALTAKAMARPVKLLCTRPDDAQMDCVRSPSVQTMRAGLSAEGAILGVEHAVAAGWPTAALAAALMPDGLNGSGKVDNFACAGADHWYTLASHRVRAIQNMLAHDTFVPGWLRSVGPGFTHFAVESFWDEIAHAAGVDPADLRLSLLDGAGKNAGSAPNSVGGATRLAGTLRRAMAKAGWGEALPADTGLGIACGFGQERTMPTWVTCVARVRVDRATGRIVPERITQVIDCGTVVSPDGAMAQAEGATLWGVSLALHEGTRFENGWVADRNLDTYTPLRMADAPALDIEFLPSTEIPVGMGEPPLVVVAPAIANAVYNAVGVRLRDLPMRPEAVLAAL